MNRETWEQIIESGTYFQELDWLAIDSAGQLGIFTATGNAPVPGIVKLSFDNYLELKLRIESISKTTLARLETKEKGDFDDWMAYAEKGFFAFGFQDIHRNEKRNQYDLIARPDKPLTIAALQLPDYLVYNIPKIDCNFRDGDVRTDKVK